MLCISLNSLHRINSAMMPCARRKHCWYVISYPLACLKHYLVNTLLLHSILIENMFKTHTHVVRFRQNYETMKFHRISKEVVVELGFTREVK